MKPDAVAAAPKLPPRPSLRASLEQQVVLPEDQDEAAAATAARTAEAKAPATTGSISKDDAGVASKSADAVGADASNAEPKSWSARAREIWEMWFGK